jgi:hypothetical protein
LDADGLQNLGKNGRKATGGSEEETARGGKKWEKTQKETNPIPKLPQGVIRLAVQRKMSPVSSAENVSFDL